MRRGVKQSTKASGHIRVISGQWKGRKLPVLDLDGLRPTTDRTKETLFNWLAPYIAQAKCLDAYAGAASLGIEALSRQANHCVFYEKDKAAARQIQSNLQLVKAANSSYQVVQGDTLQLLSQSSQQEKFDVIFVDPPFNKGLATKTIRLIDEKDWLAEDGIVYIETELASANYDTPNTWQVLKESQTKQLCYRLYQKSRE
jgi:16S rRNA (guanine966-N2)-methyltransferase